MHYDLKIAGGTIVDGTGKPGYVGDIGIHDGKIVAVGAAPIDAEQTIDATGLVVAPGFVDIHTHYDAQILWDRMLTISPWHGVTTVVMGNCGFGVAPTRADHRNMILRTLEKVEGMSLSALEAGLGNDWPFETFPEYMDALEHRGMAVNVGVLAGHTPIRTYVMGEDAVTRSEANAEEIGAMQAIVAEAMEAGALGFATSHAATHHGYDGNPVPSRLAPFEEIDALVGAMAESGRGIMQATIGRSLLHDEFIALAKTHGVPITWTALLSGLSGPGSHRKHLDRTQACVDQGLRIVPQVACRPIMFDFDFDEPFPFEMRPLFAPTMKTDRDGRRTIYADADFRRAFREDVAVGAKTPLAGWAERAVISLSPSDRTLEERPLTQVAAERGVNASDLALDLSLETDFEARFRFAILNNDEAEVEELLLDDNTVVALSDAGAHASQLCDACYSTYLLGHWVREKKAMGVEQAVAKLTSEPADLFGISDRGRLAEGLAADIVVFDPETVGAGGLQRVHDFPAGADRLVSEASGIAAVVVNGTVIRQDGNDAVDTTGDLPGRLLRGGQAGA